MLERPRRDVILSRGVAVPWDAVPSSLFDKDTMTDLIISRQALPVTPVMSAILSVMECWGRKKCTAWYHRVVDFLAFLCREKQRMSDSFIMYQCIEFRLNSLATECFGRDLGILEYNTLLDGFRLSFEMDFFGAVGMPRTDLAGIFFKLAVRSFHFIQDVADASHSIAAPVVVSSAAPVVVSSSSDTVVSSFPVSP